MKLISFSRIREECTQEEARIITREEKMGETKDQALIVHTRNNFKKKEKKENYHHNNKKDKKQKNFRKYPSNVICYTCEENGHFTRDCPKNKDSFDEKKKRL